MRLTLLACLCACLLSLSNLPAQVDEPSSISREVIADMTGSIPFPIEMSFLIKDIEMPYNPNLLTPIASYPTNFRQALHIGIYSMDLIHTNIYEQTPTVLAYLQSIKNTANDLRISEAFYFDTLKKLASTRQHIDTTLLAIIQNLENINEKLIGKDRSDLAILILTGSWTETLRLACEAYQKQPNEWLKNSIGEQKIVLEQLMLLLSFYEYAHTDYRDLIKELNKLNTIYEEVKITYTKKETTTKEGNNGEIITESTSESNIIILEETIKAIHQSINNIHQFIHTNTINPNAKTYIYKEKTEKIITKRLYSTWKLVSMNDEPVNSYMSVNITFFKNKTYIQKRGEKKRKGTWTFDTNKKQIILTPDGMKSNTLNIINLTQDMLICQDDINKLTLKKIKP